MCYIGDLIIRPVHGCQLNWPFNLDNPTEFTMLELADIAMYLTSSKSKLIHLPVAKNNLKQRQPDISLAKNELDWSPSKPLTDGFERGYSLFEALHRLAVETE